MDDKSKWPGEQKYEAKINLNMQFIKHQEFTLRLIAYGENITLSKFPK